MKAAIKGLYAITPELGDTALLIAKTEAALAGGARVVQYRNKSDDHGLRRVQALALRKACRRYHATLIINDDMGLMSDIDADGVHVGSDDCSVSSARAGAATGKILGASCYSSLARAREAESAGADYVAFGSFFKSVTKPKAVDAPLSLLTEARAALNVPIVAIGGITLANAQQVLSAGADAIAVISSLFDAADIEAVARQFCEICSRSIA